MNVATLFEDPRSASTILAAVLLRLGVTRLALRKEDVDAVVGLDLHTTLEYCEHDLANATITFSLQPPGK